LSTTFGSYMFAHSLTH